MWLVAAHDRLMYPRFEGVESRIVLYLISLSISGLSAAQRLCLNGQAESLVMELGIGAESILGKQISRHPGVPADLYGI